VSGIDLQELDQQPHQYADKHSLAKLAGQGLRGELFIPTPLMLEAAPKTLAYYRLLYGFSQKDLYVKSTGFAPFKRMEDSGKHHPGNQGTTAEIVPRIQRERPRAT
jgi:hypothetical protein